MTSFRRSTRSRTAKQSYVEAPEGSVDNSGDDSSPVTERPSKRPRRVVLDSDDDLDEGAFTSSARVAIAACGREHATASVPIAFAKNRQTLQENFAASAISKGEMPMDDEDEVIAEIAAEFAAGIDVDEDSDEEDDFIPGPDPNIEDDNLDVMHIHDVASRAEATDAEVNPDFARKLRVILDTLCEWAKSISHTDFKAMTEESRPVTLSTWRVLRKVSVEFLLAMYLPGIPREVQELFLKKTWSLADLLSLPEVEEKDANDQGLYGNFPTGLLERVSKVGCECYVGSTAVLLRRITEHLATSSKFAVEKLPKCHRRSMHYRATCRNGVISNFRKLAQFQQPIQKGYLIILESIFMVLLGSYNSPGYFAKFATKSSYEMVKDIRTRLDLPAFSWKGLNAAWPVRQGFTACGSRTASECCNSECKTMTYPRSMMPDGPKHPRVLFNSWDPLGKFLCRRCESYRERRGVLPDNATLAKLLSKYTLEVEKSNLRQTGQPVVCENCGDVEGADGVANSAAGYGTRHIATASGQILCMACDGYFRRFGKDRSVVLANTKMIRQQAKADRAAGRPVHCKYCAGVEPANTKRYHTASKQGGMVCRKCYDKKGLR